MSAFSHTQRTQHNTSLKTKHAHKHKLAFLHTSNTLNAFSAKALEGEILRFCQAIGIQPFQGFREVSLNQSSQDNPSDTRTLLEILEEKEKAPGLTDETTINGIIEGLPPAAESYREEIKALLQFTYESPQALRDVPAHRRNIGFISADLDDLAATGELDIKRLQKAQEFLWSGGDTLGFAARDSFEYRHVLATRLFAEQTPDPECFSNPKLRALLHLRTEYEQRHGPAAAEIFRQLVRLTRINCVKSISHESNQGRTGGSPPEITPDANANARNTEKKTLTLRSVQSGLTARKKTKASENRQTVTCPKGITGKTNIARALGIDRKIAGFVAELHDQLPKGPIDETSVHRHNPDPANFDAIRVYKVGQSYRADSPVSPEIEALSRAPEFQALLKPKPKTAQGATTQKAKDELKQELAKLWERYEQLHAGATEDAQDDMEELGDSDDWTDSDSNTGPGYSGAGQFDQAIEDIDHIGKGELDDGFSIEETESDQIKDLGKSSNKRTKTESYAARLDALCQEIARINQLIRQEADADHGAPSKEPQPPVKEESPLVQFGRARTWGRQLNAAYETKTKRIPRIAEILANHQRDFLATGDPAKKQPLSASAIANRLKEDERRVQRDLHVLAIVLDDGRRFLAKDLLCNAQNSEHWKQVIQDLLHADDLPDLVRRYARRPERGATPSAIWQILVGCPDFGFAQPRYDGMLITALSEKTVYNYVRRLQA